MEHMQSDPGRTEQLPEGFQLVRELARDRSRAVYLAMDLVRGGQVTLTALGRLADPGGLDNLARAMDAVTGLQHPGILPVHVVGGGDGQVYLVSPAVEGPDLGERLSGWGPLPVATALSITRQVADALDAAHRVGVVHGGVRPGVVRFAAGTDRPYLTGFGVTASSPPAAADPAEIEYVAPEQVVGAPPDPRTDVYALGGLLFHCLTGASPFRGGDANAVLHAEPPRVTAFRPELSGELDRVVATAMAKDPAARFATCGSVVEAAGAAAGIGVMPLPSPVGARPPRIRWRIVLAVLAVVALLGAGAVAVPHVAATVWPTSDDLARVPAALRGDCVLTAEDPRLPDAPRLLQCIDGEGQNVLVALFEGGPAADAAYQGVAASDPALRRGEGDCARSTGFEHRYPSVGDFRGRVLCDRVGPAARLAWIDHPNRTVAVAERSDGNAAELYRSWSRWVEQPAFPSQEEQQLLEALPEDACQRAPAGPLDGLDGVVASVECTPEGTGAGAVTYYRFADREDMRRAYDSDVARYGAPSGVVCSDTGPSGAGESSTSYIGVPYGRVTCGTGESGIPARTWTSDALLIMGRATGSDRAALSEWWDWYAGPDRRALIDATNRQATPPFPTAQEEQLLQHVPSASRVGCMRPAPDFVRNHVGDATVVGASCAMTGGPSYAFYYSFTDVGALSAAVGPGGGPDCQAVPPGSSGSARYTRPDGSGGTLNCGTNDAGYAWLSWSDERTSILGFAADLDPATLLRWWQTEAGPF
jgi:Protein kinase domain